MGNLSLADCCELPSDVSELLPLQGLLNAFEAEVKNTVVDRRKFVKYFFERQHLTVQGNYWSLRIILVR